MVPSKSPKWYHLVPISLNFLPSMKIHPVFNTVKLRPYQEDTVPGREPPPRPPPLIEGDEPEWEVEYIKDSRIRRGKLEYLLKWEGYPQEESTWQPESYVQNSPELISEFYAKHPSAVRHPPPTRTKRNKNRRRHR